LNVVLRAEALSKTIRRGWTLRGAYGQVILDRLNLEVYEGEVFGLLGLNGAGKTTLIKIFLGLMAPTSGYAWVLAKKAGHVETRRHVGFLPEVPYFSRDASPLEILDYHARLFGYDAATRKKKVTHALELVGLSSQRQSPLKQFSKGMLQRVGMAQLVINDPRLVLLDEPTYGLDPLAAKELRDLILFMKRQGTTVFLSSHQMAEVEKICDRVGVLHHGQLVKTTRVQPPLEPFFLKAVGAS